MPIVEGFLVSLAAGFAQTVLMRLGQRALGDPQRRALGRAYEGGFQAMLRGAGQGLSQGELGVVGEVVGRFLAQAEVADALLELGLTGKPLAVDALAERWREVGGPEDLVNIRFDFGLGMLAFQQALTAALIAEAGQAESPLANQVVVGRLVTLQGQVGQILSLIQAPMTGPLAGAAPAQPLAPELARTPTTPELEAGPQAAASSAEAAAGAIPGGRYHSCFISYAGEDQVFADRLHDDLSEAGVTCWYAPEDLGIGDPIRQTMYAAIGRYDRLLIILSRAAIQSDWVEGQVERALERERRQGGRHLFPVRIDDAIEGTEVAWAGDIRRRRHIGDFTKWGDERAYAKAMKRLLRDLAVKGDGAQGVGQPGGVSSGMEAVAALQMLGKGGGQAAPLIVDVRNCEISGDAMMIADFGRIPLAWRTPAELDRDLASRAVGRDEELDELRLMIGTANAAAVVGKGAQRGAGGAVLGMPGVGKSTLAAMYAERYADDYPGGVIWLKLSADMTTAESVGPELAKVAAYAFSPDVRSYRMFVSEQQLPGGSAVAALQNAQFAPEIIRALLSGHGRVLMVADNVWDPEVVAAIRKVVPLDAHLLVTTRELRVAVAVGRRKELDVLNEADALALIREVLPDLAELAAKKLAHAVGYHPLLLEISAQDLAARGPDMWATVIDSLATRVAEGVGLDGAPLPDEIARERWLEIVLDFSYETLGRAPDGVALQRRYRGLGTLAYEADFDAAVAAALWEDETAFAMEYLDLFSARSLLRRQENGRWRQHSILRGHALGKQGPEERQIWAAVHAAYYLTRMRAVNGARLYYVLAPELANLRHAFAWAAQHDFAVAQALLNYCADLLCSQKLGKEYLAWADQVWLQARERGEVEEQGRALVSRGNALQAVAALSSRVEGAGLLRQALGAYDEALTKLRKMPLAYAQIQNNRGNVLRDLAGLPGEDRGTRLRQALAAHDEAQALRRNAPLEYAQTQNNRGNLLRDLATLPGEDRGARLRQALAAYDEALDKRRDMPLDYAMTQNNRAVLLRDIATLSGENRASRLRLALDAYDEALDKLQDVPLTYAMTQNNRALLLSDLTSLPGENRAARLRQALAAYDEALGRLRDMPLAYATIQNNRGNLLSDLTSLSEEDRGARLRQALAAYDDALEKLRGVPLSYAATQNNRALVLRNLASLPGEDRGARLHQALKAHDEAVNELRAVPLDYATTQNNRAALLSDLATLPGEDRRARLQQALAACDEALAVRQDVPLDYARSQNNRAVLLSTLAALPGEDRAVLLRQALTAYDEALALQRDVPLDYAMTQNNRAALLSDLAGLPGEDHAVRLCQALTAYDEALALQRDVPLDYAMTQNNRAVLLKDLAALPGEDRTARLRQALTAAREAVDLFTRLEHRQYLEGGRWVLAGAIAVLGSEAYRRLWSEIAPDEAPPMLPAQILLKALAESEGISSNDEFQARLVADDGFRQRAVELLALASDGLDVG